MKADFSSETIEAKKKWNNMFKCLRKTGLNPEFYYPVKISFVNERDIKTSSDEGKLRDFFSSRLIPERTAKLSFGNGKEMIKERILEHQG